MKSEYTTLKEIVDYAGAVSNCQPDRSSEGLLKDLLYIFTESRWRILVIAIKAFFNR